MGSSDYAGMHFDDFGAKNGSYLNSNSNCFRPSQVSFPFDRSTVGMT